MGSGKAKRKKPGAGKETKKSTERKKSDAEFGEAMEADMERYSRDIESPGRDGGERKYRMRNDGNKNLEFSDMVFMDKIYTPTIYAPYATDAGRKLDMDSGAGLKSDEFTLDKHDGGDGKDERNIDGTDGTEEQKDDKI